MRVAFFGTPAAAVPVLAALHDAGHHVAVVVTQPERRRARGAATQPSPVHAAATTLGLPVRTPHRAREVTDELVAARRRRRRRRVRAAAAPGAARRRAARAAQPAPLAAAPLARAAPVERAILAGDRDTGVSIMRIDAGLDTGPVFRTLRTPIGADETAGTLTERLVTLGTPVLLDVLAHLRDLEPTPQVGEVTYAEKLTVEEFHLHPDRPARDLARVVRAGNPRPGAWLLVDGKRVKVLAGHAEPAGDVPTGRLVWPGATLGTADGQLILDTVQVEGRVPMPGDAWLAGFRRRHLELPVA